MSNWAKIVSLTGLLSLANCKSDKTLSAQIDEALRYVDHLARYGKEYKSCAEFDQRMDRFVEVDARINEWNSNPERTHNIGHNKFSDWHPEEITALMTYKPSKLGNPKAGSKVAD